MDSIGFEIEKITHKYPGKPLIMDAIWELISAHQLLRSVKMMQHKYQSEIDKCLKYVKYIELPSYNIKVKVTDIDIWFNELLTKTTKLIREYVEKNTGIQRYIFGEIVIDDSLLGICRQSDKNGKLFIKFRHSEIPLEALESPVNISNPTV